MKIPYWLKFTFILITLFLISLAVLRSTHVHSEFPDLAQGTAERPAFPNLILTDEKGEKKPLADFQGKVLLISFWASWCGPCLEELPQFAKLTKQYSDKLVVVPINQDDSEKTRKFIDTFWSQHQIPFVTYFDPGFELAKAIDLEVLPTNIVLDFKGRKVFESRGYVEWHGPDAQKMLTDLVREINE